MTVLLISLFSIVCTYTVPSQCSVYCEGEILKAVQDSGIYADSKTFVDMPMKYDPEVIIENFRKLDNHSLPNLSKFLRENFLTAGSEIMSWTPTDWVQNPNFVQNMRSEIYREFATQVNGMWKALGKQLIPDVDIHPQRYSIIPQKNPFIVPGERFHEFYYWDSYWIIRGLLTCGMNTTAKGILMNAFDLIKEYGFIPNGARVYYLTRSQPPFLAEMVRYYYDNTQDIELLKYALPFLEKEYNYWMNTHAVELPGGHVLNRFYTDAKSPRPESYREDMHAVKEMTEDAAQSFFSNIIAGAESGEDFTSRWFTIGSDLRSISTSAFIPVGLNSIMYKFESNMAYFYDILQVNNPIIDFSQAMRKRKEAINTYFWDASTAQWYDYSLTNNSRIMRSYPSNWFPVWAGAHNPEHNTAILESLENSGLLQMGGVLTTQLESGQQWDGPNTWAPHNQMIVQVLLELDTPESVALAETMALRWIHSTYLGYQATRMMHEKYNAMIPGASGSGGEYPPQIGFGWTNGVTLELLSLYG
jgi:alpha,alpha-trehalase